MKKLFFTVLALAGLLCAAAQTQDWANFGRFEQANGQVRNPKVVLMGNSITELWIIHEAIVVICQFIEGIG